MYDATKAEEICNLIAEYDLAKNMVDACRIVGVNPSTFLSWCDRQDYTVKNECGQSTTLNERYAQSIKISAQLAFEEFERLNDAPAVMLPSGNAVDMGWVAYNRERLNNKKWALSKRHPTKYGERIDHAITGKIEHALDRTALINRLADGHLAKTIDASIIDRANVLQTTDDVVDAETDESGDI